MTEDMHRWLDDLGLGKYSDAFAENEIDMEAAKLLAEDDLERLGLPMGPRKKLLHALAGAGQVQPPSSQIHEQTVSPVQAGERRQVTVLFADISGFTRLSSGLDAEETHALLNGFFAVVDDVVSGYGGTIDKHIGDAVMAVFGAPVAHTDDPERSLRAALAIHNAVGELEPSLAGHIGVASGQVVASATGSAAHQEYTVTGDSVNLAARLTDLAKPTETLVSATVQRAQGERFVGEPFGEELIDGLPEPISVWQLRDISSVQDGSASHFVGRSRELHHFTAAIDHCLDRKSGETIVVRGEAGIGKSRLAEEFRTIATQRGFSSHAGLVLDFGTAKGQDAIRALVRSLLGITPGSGKDIRTQQATKVIIQRI